MTQQDKCLDDLRIAIVRQACDDYDALRQGRTIQGVYMYQIERFFDSAWASQLCLGADPMVLKHRIDRDGMPSARQGRRTRANRLVK